MVYHMTIAGLERDLPVCKVSDSLFIGAFVIFGDQELTVAAAGELLKKAPAYDYLITLEGDLSGQGHPPGPRDGPAERRQEIHAGPEGTQAVHDRRI